MKEKLLDYLKRNRYGIKDLAEWLDISYQSAYNKLNGSTQWTYIDLKKLLKIMGKKEFESIFFN